MKTKIKKLVVWFCVLFSASCLLLAVVYGLASVSLNLADKWFPAYVVPSVNVPSKKPLTMKEWVMNEVAKAGLNKEEVECLIEHEGGWGDNAVGINKGSADLGMFQWNSQHIKSGFISIKCAGDYKCATKKFIEKVKADKGFSAWYGHTNGNCKSLAKK